MGIYILVEIEFSTLYNELTIITDCNHPRKGEDGDIQHGIFDDERRIVPDCYETCHREGTILYEKRLISINDYIPGMNDILPIYGLFHTPSVR